jgi:hypothetical protein
MRTSGGKRRDPQARTHTGVQEYLVSCRSHTYGSHTACAASTTAPNPELLPPPLPALMLVPLPLLCTPSHTP